MNEERLIKIYIAIGCVVLLLIAAVIVYGPRIVGESAVDDMASAELPPDLIEKVEAMENEELFVLGLYFIKEGMELADADDGKYFKKGIECLESVKPPFDGDAMYTLGQSCRRNSTVAGTDGQEYFVKAIEIFSARKDANAYYALHEIYTCGLGTQVDNDKADRYYNFYKAECEKDNKEPKEKCAGNPSASHNY